MSSLSQKPRRQRLGALVAILAGSSVAFRGAATHLDHPNVQPLWHQLFDIGSAILIVAAIFLIVFLGVRRWRS